MLFILKLPSYALGRLISGSQRLSNEHKVCLLVFVFPDEFCLGGQWNGGNSGWLVMSE